MKMNDLSGTLLAGDVFVDEGKITLDSVTTPSMKVK